MARAKAVLESAAPLIPPRATLPALREAAAACQACDLWRRGTQTVFGEGAKRAVAMFVGETLYFLRSKDFLRYLLDEERIDFPELGACVEAWKRRHEPKRPLLALPCGEE